jgi:hypothetical protein
MFYPLRAKSEEKQHSIEKDDEEEGEIPKNDDAVRQAGKKFHRPVGIGCERPGDPGSDLTQRQVKETEQNRRSGQHHHPGLGWQDERIGDQRHEWDALEMKAMIGNWSIGQPG